MKVLFRGDDEDRLFTFDCSGRQFSAVCDVVGLGTDLTPYQGYDGGLRVRGKNGELEQDDFYFSKPERKELANYMIALWTRYRDTRGVEAQDPED